MKFTQRLLSRIALIIVAAVMAHSQSNAPIGIVNSVSGDVFLHPALAPAASKDVRLQPGRAALLALHDGDVLHCGPHSRVVVTVSGRRRTLTDKDGKVSLHPDRVLTAEERRVDEAIAKFGMPGGSRAIGSLVWWPADGGAVRAENFHVRWNPPPTPEAFAIAISTAAGDLIWEAGSIDSAQGGLQPQQEEAVRRLLTQRQDGVAARDLTLTLTSEMQGSIRIVFSLLSKQEAARINEELLQWDKITNDPLLRMIGRIEALRSANLFCDLAEEFEGALKIAPNSVALLRAAQVANQRIGNSVRTHELAQRLQMVLSEEGFTPAPPE
ncbi:MAG TPA: hypothetical protein VNW97_14165 [Candidatus Saccharimonadales bacterium]|nr:hypothetical protein [Candidatus Saccharimonadales bacterium]